MNQHGKTFWGKNNATRKSKKGRKTFKDYSLVFVLLSYRKYCSCQWLIATWCSGYTFWFQLFFSCLNISGWNPSLHPISLLASFLSSYALCFTALAFCQNLVRKVVYNFSVVEISRSCQWFTFSQKKRKYFFGRGKWYWSEMENVSRFHL